MTKGTKAFRMIVCVLLAVTMLWSAFWSLGFIAYAKLMIASDQYDLFVAGVPVTTGNKGDILGNGMVSYHSSTNTLIFNNAVIETESALVNSSMDLKINLIGENKCTIRNGENISAISACDYDLYKDLSINGEGSLTIDLQNVGSNMQGIVAENLLVGSNVTVNMSECENISNGIVCASSLILVDGASVTVNNSAAKYSSAVRVRGNLLLEAGTSMNISVKAGAVETCKGLSINGDLVLGKDCSIAVSIDDTATAVGECVRVTGLLEVGENATLTASAKNSHGIECFGAMKVDRGANVYAENVGEGADIYCYGALVNCGGTVNAEVEALGEVHSKVEP